MDKITHEDTDSCILTKVLAWLVAAAGYVILISTHFHYTVDVVLGFLLTVLSFKVSFNVCHPFRVAA